MNRHHRYGQLRVYLVTTLRTDHVHCRGAASAEPVVLKVVPVTGAAFSGFTMDQLLCASLFSHPLYSNNGMSSFCLFVCISLMTDGPQRAIIGYQSHLLQSCRPACGHEGSSHLSSVLALRFLFFYHEASSALSRLVNQRLDFTYSCSHAFRYGRQNKKSAFDKNRTHDFRTTSGCARLPTRLLGRRGPLDMSDKVSIIVVCMYVCMVITYSRVWINRVRLPI